MPFEMRLREIIAKQDAEAVRELVVPYDKDRFPQPFELCESGLYDNFCQFPLLRPNSPIRTTNLKLESVVFSNEGWLYPGKNLTGLLISAMPPQYVLDHMENKPVPAKGQSIALPEQYVCLLVFSPNMIPAEAHYISGRVPISRSSPIIFYTKPTKEGKDAFGLLVPRQNAVELPKIFTLHLS